MVTPKQALVNNGITDESVAANIRRALKAKGVSARALAKSIEVPYRSLQNYLSGESRIPAELIAKISSNLMIEADLLLHGRLRISSPDLLRSVSNSLGDLLPHLMFDSDGRVRLAETAPVAPEAREAYQQAVAIAVTARIRDHYITQREDGLRSEEPGVDWIGDLERRQAADRERRKTGRRKVGQ